MATQLPGIIETVREDRDEFLLLGFVALIVVVVFLEARTLMPRTRQVPLLIAGLLAVVLVVTVLVKVFGDRLFADTNWGGGTGILDVQEGETDEETEHLFDLNSRKVVVHFAWLVAYLLGLVFVGFWTTNIVFPFVYVMRYETSPLPRRFLYFLLSTAVIVGVLWILFVEMLNVQSIWRLGFLP